MINIKVFKTLFLIFCFLTLILLIAFSNECAMGVTKGLYISANVIVPSLFPFGVIVLMILRSNIKLLPDTVFVFILSLIGGYPVGAQLIEEIYKKGVITKKGANIMQCYCINAGPAFVISAIGSSVLRSKKLGVLLLLSHILASLIIKFVLSKRLKKEIIKKSTPKEKTCDFNALFCNCVKDSATSTISICSFIILFSVINAILSQFEFLKILTYLFEVTSAVTNVKNIYLISFLLGFSGISIWVQIFSVSKQSGIRYFPFVASRIIHGILSTIFTYIAILIFKPNLPTISIETSYLFAVSRLEIAVSIIILMIVVILSLENKNNSRKKLIDLLK